MTRDPQRARALAEAAIREAALVKNHPPDLINVALERIIEASLELPAYSTLDEMAATIRAEVNEGIFAGIVARMGPEGRQRAQGLLTTAGSRRQVDVQPAEEAGPARYLVTVQGPGRVPGRGRRARRHRLLAGGGRPGQGR